MKKKSHQMASATNISGDGFFSLSKQKYRDYTSYNVYYQVPCSRECRTQFNLWRQVVLM